MKECAWLSLICILRAVECAVGQWYTGMKKNSSSVLGQVLGFESLQRMKANDMQDLILPTWRLFQKSLIESLNPIMPCGLKKSRGGGDKPKLEAK